MNEQKIAVLMDSGGDIPAELCREKGIYLLPLRVLYPEKDYADGIDIDPLMVYERFPDEMPTTSTPSLQEVLDMFEQIEKDGYEKVIAVTISSALSGTWNTIHLAASQQTALQVHVFDSKNISYASGIFALWAVKQLEQGTGFEELIRKMEEKRRDSRQFFYMDTLKYLQRGGRIGKVASFIGEALHLKPVISCNEDGVYYTVGKVRGNRMGKKRLIEESVRAAGDRPCWVIIGDGGAREEAAVLEEMLRSELPQMTFLFEKQINATLAINTGPGLLGIMVFSEP